MALVGMLPSILNSYSSSVHFPGLFVRCYLINTLNKSSCCCGDKLLSSLTLPRNCSAVIFLSSVTICLVSSPCCVCCVLTALVFELVVVKHKALSLAATFLYFLSSSFISCPVALQLSRCDLPCPSQGYINHYYESSDRHRRIWRQTPHIHRDHLLVTELIYLLLLRLAAFFFSHLH